ncbi:hypothetical protein AAHA92_32745 [Salvia divinorum]|uniref:Uncharacterized protein n=1 Tax=Salvia divinorum TaxID=28513 RepID=A0ABD1FLS6_SALDI
MGNCIETQQGTENRDGEMAGKWEKMRIKIVLSKKIEDVLDEIRRSRERSSVAWKPSLDCIVETPAEGMDI